MDERQLQILRECERFGEDEVRRRLYAGEYTAPRDRSLIEGWLHDKESAREREVAMQRDAREEETLSIAREANASAKEANRIAFLAFRARWKDRIIAITAIIIAVIAARDEIIWLIKWLLSVLKNP